MKKILLTTSMAVLLSSGAVVSAQSLPQLPSFNGESMESMLPEDAAAAAAMDALAQNGNVPSPIPGGVTNIEKAEPKLPFEGEKMSLDHFDKHYGNLVSGIDERLDNLGLQGEDNLPNPNISGHTSEIDQMGEAQRQIRLLTLKLQQAKLAKEVYDAIYPDNSKKYEERIKELEAHIVSQDAEHKSSYAELEMQVGKLTKDYTDLETRMEQAQSASNAEIEKINANLTEVEVQRSNLSNDKEDLSNQLAKANAEIEELKKVLSKYEVLEAQETSVEEEDLQNLILPGIDFISGVGSRIVATFNMPSGGKKSGIVGTLLYDGLKIKSISLDNVVVETRLGNPVELPHGAPYIPQVAVEPSENESSSADQVPDVNLNDPMSVIDYANQLQSEPQGMPFNTPEVQDYFNDFNDAGNGMNPMDAVLDDFNDANGNALNNLLTNN